MKRQKDWPIFFIVLGMIGASFMMEAEPSQNLKKDRVFLEARQRMVETQIQSRDVSDPKVLEAMRKVPRHQFVSEALGNEAYEDHPLPIGEGQTISQPYIVAKMTELAKVQKGHRVLEVGTGSGYQAAILAELGAEVYSIEIVEALSKLAAENLKKAGYNNVHLLVGDGYAGWPEAKPFDSIIVTAAPETVPPPLLEQLKEGGRLVIPVGSSGFLKHQELLVLTKEKNGMNRRSVFPVVFVPMTGKAQNFMSPCLGK